ncbi:hypothetical protein GQ54DRAFT_12976 [Martensiomyces pterosporus]|nr:hypothetical protein GQ54DRAFT_12976 [Martensiomyces pterosporus]
MSGFALHSSRIFCAAAQEHTCSPACPLLREPQRPRPMPKLLPFPPSILHQNFSSLAFFANSPHSHLLLAQATPGHSISPLCQQPRSFLPLEQLRYLSATQARSRSSAIPLSISSAENNRNPTQLLFYSILLLNLEPTSQQPHTGQQRSPSQPQRVPPPLL